MEFKELFRYPVKELIEGKTLTQLAQESGISVEGIRKKIEKAVPSFLYGKIREIVDREGFIFARKRTPFGRFLFYIPVHAVKAYRKVMYKDFVVRYRDSNTVGRIRKEVISLKKLSLPFVLRDYLRDRDDLLYRIFALKVLRAEVVKFDGEFYVVSLRNTSRVNFTIALPESVVSTLSQPYSREIKEVFFSTPKEERFKAYAEWKRGKESTATKVVNVNLSSGEFSLLEKESAEAGLKVSHLLKAVFLSKRA